jgi:DNA replication licensing factor MCM5
MCRACRSTKVLPVSSGFAGVQLPRNCEAYEWLILMNRTPDDVSQKKCPIDPYIIVHDKSHFVDQQTLKLQEIPGNVPVGELPRHMLLSADR